MLGRRILREKIGVCRGGGVRSERQRGEVRGGEGGMEGSSERANKRL